MMEFLLKDFFFVELLLRNVTHLEDDGEDEYGD